MVEVKQTERAPSVAAEIQTVVDDILSNTTLACTSKAVAAAKALGIEPSALQIVGEARNIDNQFAAAIDPIKAALAGSRSPTREDIAKMAKANELLDKLIAINTAGKSLETEVSAETILKGFKKLEGVIELTLPCGTTIQNIIQKAGEILNAAAKGKGMQHPVFYVGDETFWQTNEAYSKLKTVQGKPYRFKIPSDSARFVSKTRPWQLRNYGEWAPLGAIAIAEACERLNTENRGTLFKDAAGQPVWVRGSTSGVALISNTYEGVLIHRNRDDRIRDPVVSASSV